MNLIIPYHQDLHHHSLIYCRFDIKPKSNLISQMKKSFGGVDKRRHELITKSFQPATVNLVGEREFKPLQKKLKTSINGNDSNYVQPYYQSSDRINSIPTEDVNRLLQLNDIKVFRIYLYNMFLGRRSWCTSSNIIFQ